MEDFVPIHEVVGKAFRATEYRQSGPVNYNLSLTVDRESKNESRFFKPSGVGDGGFAWNRASD